MQSYTVAKILRDQATNRVTTVSMPEGTGKSGVCILLAALFKKLGKSALIVTSNLFLVNQYHRLMGPLKNELEVMCME